MNLSSIPDAVWSKLSKEAMSKDPNVRDLFYSHIYSKWSEGQVQYNQNMVDEVDAGWDELVEEWDKIELSKKDLGAALKDDSVGSAHIQGKGGPSSKIRLWEKYNKKARGDRFQFVVSEGGGMVLFNRMRRACQQFMIDKLGSDPNKFVVRGWKVFGEAQGIGRSDSCCVYTAVKYTDPQLETLVKDYVWPAVSDLVNANFIPLGFYKVCNKPLWAMPMPDPAREQKEFRKTCRGSAGGLMSNILAKAYTDAAKEGYSDESALTKLAKAHAAAIVKRLYA